MVKLAGVTGVAKVAAGHIIPSAQTAALEHERLNSLVNSMADGVIATDQTTKIALYNGAALNILDRNDTIESKNISDILHITDKNNQPVDIKALILNIKTATTSRDYKLMYPDNSTINLYMSIAPVHLGYGENGQRGYVLLLRDITHEKSLEEERDEFISVVSHELRTPIAIAEGNISNAEFIVGQDPRKNPDVEKALKEAHQQITFLAGLINDLATLSRAERGKLAIDVETINATELLKELESNYRPQAEAKGLKLTVILDPNLSLLQSSKLYVREILQNFITNAIKYTEKGSINIGATQKANGIEFFVQDTGIGISKTDQEKVFDKFFRSEDYRTRKNNGTGLGLYVTMKLARLVHSELDVQSELNQGSIFRIFIPNLQ